MKQFLLTLAGVFAGLLLFFVVVPFALIGMIAGSVSKPAPIPADSVLLLDLRKTLPDQNAPGPFAALRTNSLSVLSIERTLRAAEKDDRVKALFVRMPEGGIAPAAADELRLAFRHFHAAGKPVIAHSQGLYPAGVVSSTYMLGEAADALWMQPGAPFQVTGLAMEDLFYKRLFDKYGVKPDFQQRYEYKNAVNPFLYDDYTAAHRELELSWMGSIYHSALATVASDRGENEAALQKTIEAGPYTAEEALKLGLIDKVGEVEDARQAALAAAGDNGKFVDFDTYASAHRAEVKPGADVIAVVGAEGDIMTGTGDNDLFGTNAAIYSDDVSAALKRASEDKDVKAIVFRVSSPGGGDTASEQILAAVRAAKAKKAGGCVDGNLRRVRRLLDIIPGLRHRGRTHHPDRLDRRVRRQVRPGRGPVALRRGCAPRGRGRGLRLGLRHGRALHRRPARGLRQGHRSGLRRFIARVAQGRGSPEARVREIAKGRVWTGEQARSLGLVDQLGGFTTRWTRPRPWPACRARTWGSRKSRPVPRRWAVRPRLGHQRGEPEGAGRDLGGDERSEGAVLHPSPDRGRPARQGRPGPGADAGSLSGKSP